MSGFSLELSQNKYMSTSDGHMHAVLVVRAAGLAAAPRPTAEVLVVDCSSSMDWPPTKIANARRAAAAAIDALPDGAWFALVEGTGHAMVRFPDSTRLVRADDQNRARAKAVAARMIATGATAMSTWLAQARELLDRHPEAVGHTLLLTDGRNESEPPEALARVLDACEGRFTCDARGIGDDWEPDELRRIAGVLRGTADAVLDDTDLPEEFRRIIGAASAKSVPDLRLRLIVADYVRLRFLRQETPTETDLTDRVVTVEPGVLEVSTGAWGEETREYHLCLAADMAGRRMFTDLQLGRVELVPPDDSVPVPAEPTQIRAHLTDDDALSTRIDDMVQHFTVQADLSRRLKAGWVRFNEGDRAGAAAEWGEAHRLATDLGNEEVLRRLSRLIDVDPDTGAVDVKQSLRPRDGFSAVLSFATDTTSTPTPMPAGDPRSCPNCQKLSPPDARFCMHCTQPFGDEVTS